MHDRNSQSYAISLPPFLSLSPTLDLLCSVSHLSLIDVQHVSLATSGVMPSSICTCLFFAFSLQIYHRPTRKKRADCHHTSFLVDKLSSDAPPSKLVDNDVPSQGSGSIEIRDSVVRVALGGTIADQTHTHRRTLMWIFV